MPATADAWGGPLTVENPYVATAKSKKLHRYLPVAQTHASNFDDIDYHWNQLRRI